MLLIVTIVIAGLMYLGAWRATSSALAQGLTDIQNQIGTTIQATDPTAHPELYRATAEFAADLHLTKPPSLWTTPQDVGVAATFAPLNMVRWLVTGRSVTGYSLFRRFYRSGHPPNDVRPLIP